MKRKAVGKMFCAVFVLCMMLAVASLSAFASPASLPADIGSTKDGLITVCAPEHASTSTTNPKLAISAVASPGTIVTLYRFDPVSGMYQKVWVDGLPLEASVGASWLYAAQLDLSQGMNQFLIRGAWDDNTYSVARFEVDLLNEGFMDRIRGVISVVFG